jgi:hypothetical protein
MHSDPFTHSIHRIRRHAALALLGWLGVLALSTTLNARAAERRDNDTAATVEGSIQLNTHTADLKFIHAFSRAGRSGDAKRIGLSSSASSFDGRVVVVVMAARPLPDEALRALADDRFSGQLGINGVVLTADMADARHWGTEFLTAYGPLAVYGHSMISGGIEVNAGRVRGRIAYRNQDAIDTRVYQVSFDAPIAIGPPTEKPISAAEREKFSDRYRSIMPGRWIIKQWVAPGGNTTRGELTVDRRIDADRFSGSFHLIGAGGQIEVDEPVDISLEGMQVVMRGHDPSDPRWSPDHLILRLDGRQLEGGGRDAYGTPSHIVLRKRR